MEVNTILLLLGSVLFNMLVINRFHKKGLIKDEFMLTLLYSAGIITGPILTVFLAITILFDWLNQY